MDSRNEKLKTKSGRVRDGKLRIRPGELLKMLGDHMVVADVSNEIVYLAIHPVATEEDIPLCGFAFSERGIIQMLSVSVETWWSLFGQPFR